MRRISTITFIATLVAGWSPTGAQEGENQPVRAEADSYVIGVEDVLSIVTWGEEKPREAKVRSDGRITLPLINDVKVAGLTPTAASLLIAEKMKSFVNEPNITVIVDESNYFRVYFLGEINTQGPQQFYRPTRLLQGLATAGGLTEFSKKRITILREEWGVERRIEIDYKKLWAGDPSQENLYLEPGDTLLVD